MAWGRLALIHAAGEADEVLPKMAVCLSYWLVKDSRQPSDQYSSVSTRSQQSATDEAQASLTLARFLRVRRRVSKQTTDDSRAGYLDNPEWRITPEVQRRGGTYQFAKPTQLLPMSRLTPFLLNALGQQRPGAALDHRQLARCLAKGLAAQRLPFLLRQRWSQRLLIIVDTSVRLEPYWADFEFIVLQLQQQLGAEAVQAIRFDEGSRRRKGFQAISWPTSEQAEWFPWVAPAANVPVLILGDLGVGDNQGSSRAFWLRLARRLYVHDAPLLTLNPLSVSGLNTRVVRQLRPAPLNDGGTLPRYPSRSGFSLQAMDTELQVILGWLSALPLVDAGLLRSLRLAFRWGNSDLEGLLWNHADVQQTPLGIRVRRNAVDKYQQYYQDKLAGTAQAVRFWELVEAHHQGAFEGLRQLEKLNRCVLEETDGREVGDYLQRLAASISQGAVGSAQRKALIMQCRTYLAAQPQRIWESELSELAYDLYALAHEDEIKAGQWPEVLENGFDPARAAKRVLREKEQLATERWQIVQVGDQGEFAFRRAQEDGDLLMTTVAEVTSLKGLPPNLLFPPDDGGKYVLVQEGRVYSVRQGVVGVESASDLLELDAIAKPSWASRIWRDNEKLKAEVILAGIGYGIHFFEHASSVCNHWVWPEPFGEDQYGLYAALNFNSITQRFRWIEPGTFIMGSPKDERGRYDDEDQHTVTLTEGYWLADTTVTQELWEDLMGKNPSHFTDNPSHPVELVSWNDCMEFIASLNKLIPGLQAKLPTEAQWEYACRAGTSAAFNFVEKEPKLLREVNYSGQWDELDDNGTTMPVRTFKCNDWGLYEMHGNVWEWCEDVWQGSLGSNSVIDPCIEQLGNNGSPKKRVLRGGAWRNKGRSCRSAARYKNNSDFKFYGFGLRLAIKHVSAQITVESSDKDKKHDDERLREFLSPFSFQLAGFLGISPEEMLFLDDSDAYEYHEDDEHYSDFANFKNTEDLGFLEREDEVRYLEILEKIGVKPGGSVNVPQRYSAPLPIR